MVAVPNAMTRTYDYFGTSCTTLPAVTTAPARASRQMVTSVSPILRLGCQKEGPIQDIPLSFFSTDTGSAHACALVHVTSCVPLNWRSTIRGCKGPGSQFTGKIFGYSHFTQKISFRVYCGYHIPHISRRKWYLKLRFTTKICLKSRFTQLNLITNHRDKKSFHFSRGNNFANYGSQKYPLHPSTLL